MKVTDILTKCIEDLSCMSEDDFKPGSIAAAMNHFVKKLQWDISSPSKLSESIKDFFEKWGTGGA